MAAFNVPMGRDIPEDVCTGCKQSIKDRYLLKILGQPWHVECVKCSECQSLLNEKCYTRDFKLFCRMDFFRLYGTKCQLCKEGLCPEDLVRKTVNGVYHVKCFTCSVCKRQLETGEQMYLVQGEKFVCEADYLRSVQAVQNIQYATPPTSAVLVQQSDHISNASETSSLPAIEPLPPDTQTTPSEKKKKGGRTTLTSSQLQKLTQVYEHQSRPTKETKLQLAKATGLDVKVIQNWFQNQRSKKKNKDVLPTQTTPVKEPPAGLVAENISQSFEDDSSMDNM